MKMLVAKFFRDKRLGTDTVFKDSTKIVHVDELLKFLTAMTGDRAYEQVIEMNEEGKKVDSMCEMAQRMISRGREEGRMKEIFESIQEGDYDVKRGAQKLKSVFRSSRR